MLLVLFQGLAVPISRCYQGAGMSAQTRGYMSNPGLVVFVSSNDHSGTVQPYRTILADLVQEVTLGLRKLFVVV
jgi:hypothetical protein